jgi:hypothetical protein
MPNFFGPTEAVRAEGTELWWVKIINGVSVYRIGGVWYQQRFPSESEFSDADRFYKGGVEYTITTAEAADLTAAGFGDYIY